MDGGKFDVNEPTVSSDERLDFIKDFILKAFRVKIEKWDRMYISDEQRAFIHRFLDTERPQVMIKVEMILKGGLDLIPPPSVKIQIMGGKVCLRYKGKTLLGVANKLLKTKSLLSSPSNVLPYYLK